MGLADHAAQSSPFRQWLIETGAELEFDETEDRYDVETWEAFVSTEDPDNADNLTNKTVRLTF